MSTKPEPWESGMVEMVARIVALPGSVGLAQAHPPTKTAFLRSWSSHGPPHPLGRWSSVSFLLVEFVYELGQPKTSGDRRSTAQLTSLGMKNGHGVGCSGTNRGVSCRGLFIYFREIWPKNATHLKKIMIEKSGKT